jgi:hypothetical protein
MRPSEQKILHLTYLDIVVRQNAKVLKIFCGSVLFQSFLGCLEGMAFSSNGTLRDI